MDTYAERARKLDPSMPFDERLAAIRGDGLVDPGNVRPNPVVDLIQAHPVGRGRVAVELVDVDDQKRVGGQVVAPGARVVVHGGRFAAGPATFVLRGHYWYLRGAPPKALVHGAVGSRVGAPLPAHAARHVRRALAWYARELKEHGARGLARRIAPRR